MKKIAFLILTFSICFSLCAAPAAAQADGLSHEVTPYAVVHCQQGDQLGRLVYNTTTTQIDTQIRSCIHGGVGVTDWRTLYQVVTTVHCTLCAYESVTDAYTYWGSWICGK
ncbi:MAG TPA: hypothetical protein PKB13_11625 [Clostridia bacterium]|nr:hypothetical protein [Clostridia bacterium]